MGKHAKRSWRWWPAIGVATAMTAVGGYVIAQPDQPTESSQPTADTGSTPKIILPPHPAQHHAKPKTPARRAVSRRSFLGIRTKAPAPGRHKAPPPPPAHRPTPPPPSARPGRTSLLVDFLKAQVGKPYVFGAAGPNVFDCSGLLQTAFARIGVHLPRTSEEQSLIGARVGLDELRPGDTLFWGPPGAASHSAVYIGNGHYVAAENPLAGVVNYTISFYRPDYGRRII